MKLYKDSSLKEEITTLDLGTVEAGSKKEFTFYVVNDQDCVMENLEFLVANKEVKIFSAPKVLSNYEKAELVVEWKPSVTIKRGLKTSLEIKGYEVWE